MKRVSSYAALAALGLIVPAVHLHAAPAVPAAGAAAAPTQFFFHDGDRAVIVGDSITEQRAYSTLVESYVLARYPAWNITFRNTGWNGDTMDLSKRSGLEAGFARDLAPLRATAVTIDFGMNDGRGGDGAYATYLASARTLATKFKALGARVAFLTPSPEEKFEPGAPAGSGYNNTLLKFSDGLKTVAAENGAVYVDQIRPIIETIEAGRRAKVLGELGNPRLIPDGVHPNWNGHLIMAMNILKGLGAPSLVSSVEIDAKDVANPKVTAENAKVTVHPVAAAAGPAVAPIEFERLDNALPWPGLANAETSLVQTIPGFTPMQDLSRYELKITGLTAPKYEVRCDKVAVGTWTKEELAAGLNLSRAPGPVQEQVGKLFQKIAQKNEIFYNKWRNVQLYSVPAWLQVADIEAARAKEIARLDVQLVDAEKELYTLRQPVVHTWTVTAVPVQ